MKTLYILRHAKSSRDKPGLADFDRPLNERGTSDAARMGEHLAERKVRPERLVASPARRARDTIEAVALALGRAGEDILYDDRLYAADTDEMLAVVRGFDPAWSSVLVAGHNPVLTDFGNFLTGGHIANIPTCGALAVELDVEQWKDVCAKCGRAAFFDVPNDVL